MRILTEAPKKLLLGLTGTDSELIKRAQSDLRNKGEIDVCKVEWDQLETSVRPTRSGATDAICLLLDAETALDDFDTYCKFDPELPTLVATATDVVELFQEIRQKLLPKQAAHTVYLETWSEVHALQLLRGFPKVREIVRERQIARLKLWLKEHLPAGTPGEHVPEGDVFNHHVQLFRDNIIRLLTDDSSKKISIEEMLRDTLIAFYASRRLKSRPPDEFPQYEFDTTCTTEAPCGMLYLLLIDIISRKYSDRSELADELTAPDFVALREDKDKGVTQQVGFDEYSYPHLARDPTCQDPLEQFFCVTDPAACFRNLGQSITVGPPQHSENAALRPTRRVTFVVDFSEQPHGNI